jgi:hypothetical protein
MRIATQFGATLTLLVCLASGCRLFPGKEPFGQGNSPLRPAQSSPDSVAMEIIWARFPANDPVLDNNAWREIDETQIEPAVRTELANNGLRAGVISGSIPSEIAKVLHQGESTPEDSPTATATAKPDTTAKLESAELLTEPLVHGRTRHVRRNQRTEIQASEVYPTLQLLVRGGTELGGHTYQDAQAIYALRVNPQPDRSATVELTPELHYGQPRFKWRTGGDDGLLRQAPLRDQVVFDRLRLSVKLAPGEMLVLMSLPDAGSLLGHYFHNVESADGPQQKLILIRLAEIPTNDTFAASGKF